MTILPAVRLLSLALCSLVAGLAAGCGGAPAASALALREPDVYEGCASDENWVTIDDAERAGAGTDAALAPRFTVPTADAVLDGAMPARLAWQQTATEAGDPLGDSRCVQCSVCGPTRMHLPPVRGTVYDVQIADGEITLFRAITTLQVLTPPPARWAEWRGRALTIRAWRVLLDENVPVGGAHGLPSPLPFRVAP